MKKYILLAISFFCISLMANAQTLKDVFTQEVVREMNAEYPQQVDDGLIMNKVFIEDNYFGMEFLIDESEATLSDIRKEIEQFNGAEMAGLMFGDDQSVPKLLIALNVGIKMKFVSQQTGEAYIRSISVQDFKAAF